MRERFTYRFLTQLIGAIVVLFVAVIKATKTPITIGTTTLEPDGIESIIAAVGGVLAIVVPIFIPDSNKPILSNKDASLSDATRTDNRQRMLDKVEAIWITGYLDHVLNEMAALRLAMKFIEPKKVLERAGMTDEDLPDSGAILSAFNELGRRLVILGEPGAGKTVTLLQLCGELIKEANEDKRKPIPLVLALSSWAAERLPFEEWLRKEVREKYGLPKKVANDFVVGERLLYLLDGLDEVAEAQRDACLQAIQRFVEDKDRHIEYVICCRFKEFEELSTHLNLLGQLMLQPLDDKQIGEYLSGDESAGLVSIWNESAMLREFGRVPFMLNTIAIVTRGKKERQIQLELGTLNDAALLRDEILETYFNRRLQETTNARYANLRKTRKQLKWLGQQLIAREQTDFYIENLQPINLDNSTQMRHYKQTFRMTISLVLSLTFCLAFCLIGILIGNMIFGLTTGVLMGLMAFWLAFSLAGAIDEIEIADQLRWSFSGRRLGIGLGLGLTAGLILGLTEYPMDIVSSGPFGLAIGLAIGLAGGFVSEKRIEIQIRPNSGIRQSLANFMVVWLATGLVGSLAFGLHGGLTDILAFDLAFALKAGLPGGLAAGLAIGLAFGLSIGLVNGGASVIQHCILRLVLARAGHIPYWRYDKFLDYCANDLIILRKVGGGYRFVHDYLRQYLASAPIPPEN